MRNLSDWKIYSFLGDSNSKHKKAKGVNRNIVETPSRNEYKDVLLNNKCLRHSLNRIQSKDHRIGTTKFEINEMRSAKFHCLVLIRQYIFKTMDMMN